MRRRKQLNDVLDWVGRSGTDALFNDLDRFSRWLATDGRDAGGIGPKEPVWERHILDSLMFAKGFGVTPISLVDLGGGIGLPGIPLAMLFPDAEVTLVDRSNRRMRLARRACRVLNVKNLTTTVGDIAQVPADTFEGAVMRAVLPPTTGIQLLKKVITPSGVGVFGVGLDVFHVKHEEGENIRFPGSEVLDPGRWIHIMQ